MSNVSKRRKEGSRPKIKSMGDHKEFLKRITKTLYYGQLPTLPCLSLPVTEISCEVWSVPQRGRSLRRLHADAAAGLARGACVSPCALVLALLYLERLRSANPDYLAATPPADLFLVSLMVGNKFLQDDGEDDEVICSEWAASGGVDLEQLKKLEVEFLNAIDWNVFVSDRSFETGLQWLERRVALKQAQARGYFTYAAAAYLASVGALLALLASAMIVSRVAAPPAAPAAVVSSARLPASVPADIMTPDVRIDYGASLPPNATERLSLPLFLDDSDSQTPPRCCTRWERAPRPAAWRTAEPRPWSGGWAARALLPGLVAGGSRLQLPRAVTDR